MIFSILKRMILFCLRLSLFLTIVITSFVMKKLWEFTKTHLMFNPFIRVTVHLGSIVRKIFLQRCGAKKQRAPLKLLDLPMVAIHQVMKNMNPHELVMLSLCSTSSKMAYKTWKTKSMKLAVYLTQNPNGGSTHEVLMMEENEKLWYSFLVDNSQMVPTEETVLGDIRLIPGLKQRYLKTRFFESWTSMCEDKIEGLRKWTDYAMDLFDCRVESFTLDTSILDESKTRETLQWIVKYRKTIKTVKMEGELSEKNTRFFMKNFRKNHGGQVASVGIFDSKWIRLIDVLAMKSQFIDFRNTTLTDTDLNSLIKQWVDMKLPNLQFICFRRKKDEPLFTGKVKRGIQVTKDLFDEIRMMRVPAMKEPSSIANCFIAKGGIEIQRKDGVTAFVATGTIVNSKIPIMILAVQPEILESY